MFGRTLFYRLLLVCPVLYIGAIAVRARMHIDPFAFAACTKKQHDQILAYRQPYLDALPFRTARGDSVDRHGLRKVADSWIRRMKDRTLHPLTPVDLDDSVRDGVKQQIFQVSDRMSHLLHEIATREKRAGQYEQAARDLVMSVRLSEVLKYSDPYSVAQTGVSQRQALMALAEIANSLGQQQRKWLKEALIELRNDQRSLAPMIRLIVRLHDQEAGPSGVQALDPVISLLERPDEARKRSLAVLANLPRPSECDGGSQIDTEVLGLLRMSGQAQESLLDMLDQRIASLGGESVVENPKGTRVASAGS